MKFWKQVLQFCLHEWGEWEETKGLLNLPSVSGKRKRKDLSNFKFYLYNVTQMHSRYNVIEMYLPIQCYWNVHFTNELGVIYYYFYLLLLSIIKMNSNCYSNGFAYCLFRTNTSYGWHYPCLKTRVIKSW